MWVTLQNFVPVPSRSWQGRWAHPGSPPTSISKFCREALCRSGGKGLSGAAGFKGLRGEERKDRVLVYLVFIFFF